MIWYGLERYGTRIGWALIAATPLWVIIRSLI